MVVLDSVVLQVESRPSPPRSSRLVPSEDFEYWCLRDTPTSALGTDEHGARAVLAERDWGAAAWGAMTASQQINW